jgi:hypothetical protein
MEHLVAQIKALFDELPIEMQAEVLTALIKRFANELGVKTDMLEVAKNFDKET